MLVLNIEKLPDFLRWASKLFHSIMVDGKQEFSKKLCFMFRRKMLFLFRVEYNEHLAGIKLKRYLELSFSKTL